MPAKKQKRLPRYKPKDLRDRDTLEQHRENLRVRQRRWSAANGGRAINFRCDIESAASLLYLKKHWGFKTGPEAIKAALCFLMVVTRLGLQRVDARVYDVLLRAEEERKND
jgi:hypothetical protein